MSTFQIVTIGVFIFFVVVGVLIFASFGGLGGGQDVGKVVIWGTLKEQTVKNIIAKLAQGDDSWSAVEYVEKKPESYTAELLDSFAARRAPDLFLLPQENIIFFSDKVSLIPFGSVSERAFRNSFIEGAQIYLAPQGAVGLPFLVDPLVMYYNPDIFAGAGVAQAPRFWDELFTLAPKLTSLDATSNVRRSAVALGEYRNVTNAKEILAALFLQAGENFAAYDAEGVLTPVFGENQGNPSSPAESALRFYTEFSNPAKSVYSWNRALPESRKAFTAGDIGVYFGFASEYRDLLAANPNLTIRVAGVPQVEGGKKVLTFGKMQAFAIPKGAANPRGALIIAQKFASDAGGNAVTEVTGLPPAQRSLLSTATPGDAVLDVFYDSAIMAAAWRDPDAQATARIFQEMIESVTSGRSRLTDAVRDAGDEMSRLYTNR